LNKALACQHAYEAAVNKLKELLARSYELRTLLNGRQAEKRGRLRQSGR
jgi:hypothetical protein